MSIPTPPRRNARPCLRGAVAGLAALALLAGCSGRRDHATAPPFDASPASLLERLADPMSLPDLRLPGGQQLSSTDITGGNDDWLAPTTHDPSQWETLADLTGPGFVSRFWMTGWSDYEQRVRLFFDDEATPRFDLSVLDLFGRRFPFLAPFARHENQCAYSVLPMPFARRLRVEIQAGKPGGKFYFQLNHSPLPEGSKVTSLSPEWTAEERAAWKRAASVLESRTGTPPGDLTPQRRTARLAPGASLNLETLKGPGVIRELRCTPRLGADGSSIPWHALLRQTKLRIRWNEESHASVELPLGDFFGQNTRLTAYRSLAHAFDGATLSCLLPMPFRVADISVENTGASPMELDFEILVQALPELPAHLGYLHAGWQGSWPEDVGPPHSALRVQGEGKYVGGVLSIDSGATSSWWGLEGDEVIRMDDAFMPQWKGTGIEDHYNGGWYYRVPLAEYLNGLLLRLPYHAVQYRWHVLDAPRFARSMDLHFERGGENEAPLLMESAAWYYLAAPGETDTDIPPFAATGMRNPSATEKSLCHHLAELERFGDIRDCRRLLRGYLEENPAPSAATERIQLRELLYREHMEGIEAVAPALAEFQRTATQTNLVRAAADRLWLRSAPTNALLQVASATSAEVWYAGRKLGVVRPGSESFRVSVPSQPTAVAVVLTENHPAGYLHVALVSATRAWYSDETWRYRENPPANWEQAAYNDSDWTAYFPRWMRMGVPPATADSPPGLLSIAENLSRPVAKPPSPLVFRRVWSEADSQPALGAIRL